MLDSRADEWDDMKPLAYLRGKWETLRTIVQIIKSIVEAYEAQP